MWFPLRREPPGWTGPWTFTSVNELPEKSVDETWSILQDDAAWCHWHPEVTDMQWQTGDLRGVGATRTMVFTGSVTIREEFDLWEDNEPDHKKFGFCITATTRPVWLGNRAAREEFRVEALSSSSSSSGTEGAATATITTTGSKFTRTFTVDPSFAVRYLLGFMVYPYLSNLFEHELPRRFDQMYNTNMQKTKNTR
jgi:Polyketide cyclase / dehydrase and lipid transport